MLILFAPGAPREGYFRETAQIAAAGRELSCDEWTEFSPGPTSTAPSNAANYVNA